MGKTSIKIFAVWARVTLMDDIRTKFDFLGITGEGIASPLSASTKEIQYFDIGADHPVLIKGNAIRQRETIADQIHKAEKESNYANAYQHLEVRAIEAMLDHITDSKQVSTDEKYREHLKKQLDELTDYEERLEHMANERIAIALDDGVKVNYVKVQTDRNGRKYKILAPIK